MIKTNKQKQKKRLQTKFDLNSQRNNMVNVKNEWVLPKQPSDQHVRVPCSPPLPPVDTLIPEDSVMHSETRVRGPPALMRIEFPPWALI